ncbi:serine acetyltransferase [Campylobacterota bacterium]|nr:serine acetyltransferase [Campylobacterota bacterium]
MDTKPVVDLLLKSYREHSEIIRAEVGEQLNKHAIVEIIEKLRCLIYPGFFTKTSVSEELIESYTEDLLNEVYLLLTAQIRLAMRGEKDDATAKEIASKFLAKLPLIREILSTDVVAAYNGDPAAYSNDEIVSSYPGIYAITVYRLAHELFAMKVPMIPRIMTEHAHSRTGIDIHPGAEIGHHFFIDHGTGIVIGQTTVIGNFVKLYQGVTLGALSTRGGQMLKDVKRHPTIENHVTIYSGASILGGATVIGEGVVIGSNAFVTKSVAENTRVSVKNQELQFKLDGQNKWVLKELQQEDFWCYMI